LKDRLGEPEGGSEWELIKILLEGDENSNKMNTTTQVGQDHVATQVPKRKASKSLQENRQERAPKITKKNEREQHIQALRNHAE
jgi:hypothetical protein